MSHVRVVSVPELPEVETVRRSLKPLVGQRLVRIVIHDGRLRYLVTPALVRRAAGETLRATNRLGKYLVFEFPSDIMVFHLGMTGRMIISSEIPSPYTKVTFYFDSATAHFVDVRRFGFVLSGAAARTALPRGIDALADLNASAARICASSAEIKSILLNQALIAGLGNIYVAEILYRARISPLSRGKDLSKSEVSRILKAIPVVLQRAIEAKGSTISDFAYSLPGEVGFATGSYQKEFLVYNRAGLPCRRCGTKILQIRQSGRSTYYCPRCQPDPTRARTVRKADK
jgi:formamidopyrimidine-DNA glycosylase